MCGKFLTRTILFWQPVKTHMASEASIERLFALPYFQQMFDRMIKPLGDACMQLLSPDEDEDIDPEILARANTAAQKFTYRGMMGLVRNHYLEILSDAEVDYLCEAYQNPVFLKLLNSAETMLPTMVAWLQDNEEALHQHIDEALAEPV
jgi:hypothetical protein